jgi:phosphopantetheinyl transferase (holo-ACP synthase)
VLSPAERHELASRRLPPARRLAWLAARTAAKEALADLLLAHHGLRVGLREIELLADERGRPVAGGPALDGLPEPVGVSLAHRGDHAIALVALGAAPGIDLEVDGPRPERFNDVAFAEEERALLATLGDVWALRCFCAKEAAGKALGTGLPGGPRDMTVSAVDPDERLVTVHVTASGGPELLVRCTQQDNVIVATTLIEKGAPR